MKNDSGMLNNKWYVLYTSARAEKRVEERLREMGVEVFLPIHRCRRRWSDRIKTVEMPLFKSYVFVKHPEHKLRELLLVNGVARILYYLHRPAVVREEEIEAIKEFLSIAIDRELISRGDKVEIIAGALESKKGEVLMVGKDAVILVLEELGVKICVSLSQVNKLREKSE
ncbi:MAG: UpxY family transcription antiterminator [Bacteroidales bacterium]|nr:UpxY family transcription antiterminator [Bacteroidales bacterium]MDD3990283.1 UpxY family transcription antiterminator [Bacteroidales bacterium]